MITFYRKIRQRLLAENKLTRYLIYAIGEIALVMIGILLALQVSNWNEERIIRKKEKGFLKAIHQEFVQNKVQLDTVISYHKKSFKSLRHLISLFPIDVEKSNLDSISYYLNNALYSYTFNPSQGSINSIVNTSSFDMIQNDTLRNILISWADLVVDLQEDENSVKTTTVNLIDPYLSRNIDYNFDFKDKRNNLKALESIEFEYLIRLRYNNFQDIFNPSGELVKVVRDLDRIIELTRPADELAE